MSEDELMMFYLLHEENKAIAQMVCDRREQTKIRKSFDEFWDKTIKIISEVENED